MKLRQSTSSSEQDPAGHGDGSARPATAGAGKQPVKAGRRKGSGTWSFLPALRIGEKALEEPGSIWGGFMGKQGELWGPRMHTLSAFQNNDHTKARFGGGYHMFYYILI